MNWIDVTLPLHNAMPTWPGDPAPSLETVTTVAGHGCMVSRLILGSHTGTHVDAPCHFLEGAGGVDAIPPWRLLGPCQILDCRDHDGHISAEFLQRFQLPKKARLLFKTRNDGKLNVAEFHRDYVALDVSAALYLTDQEVALVGIDYLSIEPFGSSGHPVHVTLLKKEVAILEGLDLSKVEAGQYQLVAAPLRLLGLDGSPARVWLGQN